MRPNKFSSAPWGHRLPPKASRMHCRIQRSTCTTCKETWSRTMTIGWKKLMAHPIRQELPRSLPPGWPPPIPGNQPSSRHRLPATILRSFAERITQLASGLRKLIGSVRRRPHLRRPHLHEVVDVLLCTTLHTHRVTQRVTSTEKSA